MSTELKSCPFCGASADIYIYAEQDELIVQAKCTDCKVSKAIQTKCSQNQNELQWMINEATKDWNTRSAITDKRFTDETTGFHYNPITDQIELTLRSDIGTSSVIYDRTRLKTHLAQCDIDYKNYQQGEWWPSGDNVRCNKCNYESRYMFTNCPGCKRKMKNGTEMI